MNHTDHDLEAFLAAYLEAAELLPAPPLPRRRTPRRTRRGHVTLLSYRAGPVGIYDPHRRKQK